MAKLSLNLSVSWENQDEFNKLLKDVAETQFAYNKALEALNGFRPEMKVVTGYNKEEATNKQFDDLETYQKILEDDVAELKRSKKKSLFSRK